MLTKKRLLNSIPIKDTNKQLDVELYYSKGGMNYFTGNVLKRGIYISVIPYEISDNFRTSTAFSGICDCVKELKRFSQKELDNCIVPDDKIKLLVNHVISKNNFELA